MVALELPVTEKLEESLPVNFSELEIDLAAFQLWQEASRLDAAGVEESA
jgi:hypothetical protein